MNSARCSRRSVESRRWASWGRRNSSCATMWILDGTSWRESRLVRASLSIWVMTRLMTRLMMKLEMCSGNPSRSTRVEKRCAWWMWKCGVGTRLPVVGSVYMFGEKGGWDDSQTGSSTQCDRCRWLFVASRPQAIFLQQTYPRGRPLVIYPLIPDTIQQATRAWAGMSGLAPPFCTPALPFAAARKQPTQRPLDSFHRQTTKPTAASTPARPTIGSSFSLTAKTRLVRHAKAHSPTREHIRFFVIFRRDPRSSICLLRCRPRDQIE